MAKSVKMGYEVPRTKRDPDEIARESELHEKFDDRRVEILETLGRDPSIEDHCDAISQAHTETYGDASAELKYEIDEDQ